MRKMLFLLFCFSLTISQLTAQSHTVKGKVTDDKGAPVPNASVLVKGTTIGTATGSDGTFALSVPASAKILVFSSVGFNSQEFAIGSKTAFNVSLQASTQNLEEVVVVGYGTQKKTDLTASIAKIGGDKVANVPLSSVDQALQGKVAGLQSVTFSGQPGANQQVRIRGISSYSASAQPLYVIDGVQINSGDLSRLSTTSNVLANINPDDIESISVLKDAAATAIYGSRGSNGVILINTKRGKAGKTQFAFSAEGGTNSLGNIPDAAKPLNSSQWLTLFKEGIINAGYNQATADATAANYGDGSVDTKWLDVVTRKGTQQQYNLSASGGDEKTKFFISGGYFKQEAATIGADLSRFSSTINIDHIASRKLTLSLSLKPTVTTEHAPLSNGSQFGNPILDVFFLRPTQNPYNADGTLNITRTTKDFSSIYNPLYIANNDQHNYSTFSGIADGQIKYSILDNLKFTSKMGMQYSSLEEYQYNNPYHGDGVAANGRGYAYYTRYFLYDWTNQLDYHFNVTKDKSLSADARVGYESISSKGYFISSAAQNFPPGLTTSTVGATVTDGRATGSDYTFASVYSTLSFNYNGKYILSGNFRRDGSSRFSTNNKYGNFPAVSVGWNVNKEEFFSKIKFVSDLKIRASYGTTGNAEIGNYPWQTLEIYGGTGNYNNQPGGVFSSLGNPGGLSWEKTNQTDIGFDASFLKNRLSVTFDYYNKKTTALLFSIPLSQATGFATETTNLGGLTNKGLELTINGTPLRSKDFSWDLNFNITNNKNTVDAIPAGQPQIPYGTGLILKPGYDIQSFYLRQWAGVDPATGSPLWYVDGTKSATTTNYNAAARVLANSASPKYYGGFSNTFTYKFLSLSADLYYNYGNYVYDAWAFYLTDQVSPSYGKYSMNLQRWQKAGDITNVPKAVYGSANFSANGSTRFLYKGDYIRLRNVTLSYVMPSSLLKKLNLISFRVYARGTNLWTKTYDNNLTIDPEVGIAGSSNLNIFYNKSVTFGINVGF